MPSVVENPHHHLWTDALHARALSHQARNKWDRGTYVRWTVTTAWTVLEIACQDALQDKGISYSFKKNMDKAIAAKGLPPLDWSQGTWQRVRELQETRKGFMHRFPSEKNLFPPASSADDAIQVVRDAVLEIYEHCGRPAPQWIHGDDIPGWQGGGAGLTAKTTLIRAGTREDDPEVVKIGFVHNGKEHVSEILPPGTDHIPYVDDLIKHVRVPISAVRVYRGSELIDERSVTMRGASG